MGREGREAGAAWRGVACARTWNEDPERECPWPGGAGMAPLPLVLAAGKRPALHTPPLPPPPGHMMRGSAGRWGRGSRGRAGPHEEKTPKWKTRDGTDSV